MSQDVPQFVGEAEAYWSSNGWTTEINDVDRDIYAVAGYRETGGGAEHGLLFVVPDSDHELTADTVTELSRMSEANEATTAVTTRGSYTDGARRTAESAGIEVIPADTVRARRESPQVGQTITFPEAEGSSDEADEDDESNPFETTGGSGPSAVPTSGDDESRDAEERRDQTDTAPTNGQVDHADTRFGGDQQTLEVEQASRLGDSTKHYNLDNIAFFQSIDISVTLLGKLLLYGVPTLAGGVVMFRFSEPLAALAVFVALFVPQWYLMRFRDRATIGTLSSNDRIASNELDTLESLFKQGAANLITIAGTKKRFLWYFDYRHHLVPDNIVSVQRASRVRGKLYFVLIFVLLFAVKQGSGFLPVVGGGYAEPRTDAFLIALLTLTAYAFEMGYVDLPLDFGDGVLMKTVQYTGVAFVFTVVPEFLRTPRMLTFVASEPRYLVAELAPAVLLGLVLGLLLRGTRNAVLVQLQSGDDKVFIMEDDDADRVVSEFKNR